MPGGTRCKKSSRGMSCQCPLLLRKTVAYSSFTHQDRLHLYNSTQSPLTTHCLFSYLTGNHTGQLQPSPRLTSLAPLPSIDLSLHRPFSTLNAQSLYPWCSQTTWLPYRIGGYLTQFTVRHLLLLASSSISRRLLYGGALACSPMVRASLVVLPVG